MICSPGKNGMEMSFLVTSASDAAGRFSVEFLRGDENRGFVFHHLLSTSQFIALLVLAGIASVFLCDRFMTAKDSALVPGSSDIPGYASGQVTTTGGVASRAGGGGTGSQQTATICLGVRPQARQALMQL